MIDGRGRLRPTKDAGLANVPVVDTPINGDDPVVYMIRAASKRRQLTDDQRVMPAEEERKWLAKKGRERSSSTGGKAKAEKCRETTSTSRQKSPIQKTSEAWQAEQERKSDRARTTGARAHNVSERKARQAQAVAAAWRSSGEQNHSELRDWMQK